MKKFLALLLAVLSLWTVTLSVAGCAEQKMPSFSINEAGELICTLPDGSTQNLGKVRGQDGEDGQDGRDGLDGKDGQNGLNGKDGINGQDGKDGADGQDGKDGEDGKVGSVITIGDNGHWYIDGEDTFIIEGKRDAIEVDMTGEAFGPEIPLPVQFRTEPQTDHELNLDYVNIRYDDNGTVDRISLQSPDVKDVYALYDMICRDFYPDMNGLLLILDTSRLTCVTTTYTLSQNSSLNNYKKLLMQYSISGYVKIENDYFPFEITINPIAVNEEQSSIAFMTPDYADTFARYICADGDKIITQPSQLMLVGDIWRVSGSDFGDWVRPDITSCGGGIYYPKTKGNPYTEDMPKLAAAVSHEDEYYFLNVVFQFYDELSMSDEEVYNAVRSIMGVLKDSFVVYDYDHYRHQFDHE